MCYNNSFFIRSVLHHIFIEDMVSSHDLPVKEEISSPDSSVKEEIEILVKEIAGEFPMLGNRYTGEIIRHKMKEILDNDKIVILNFDGISGITQGFGDELIGIFVRAFGPDYIKGKVKLKNETELIKSILNWVYKYSKRMYKEKIEYD